MNIKDTLKKCDTLRGFVNDFRKAKTFYRKMKAQSVIKTYIRSNQVRKLQLGSGSQTLNGWLNTDIASRSKDVLYLDATKRFPFDNNLLDYIQCEHMIEHLEWSDGLFMLRECYRVLKPGGKLRIATPDLEVFINLYNGDEKPIAREYIKWMTDICIKDAPGYKASFVINNAFRNWGHQFLYDSEVLLMTMEKAGFENFEKFSPGVSDDPHLRNIEKHGIRAGNEKMSNFETMVYEATKGN